LSLRKRGQGEGEERGRKGRFGHGFRESAKDFLAPADTLGGGMRSPRRRPTPPETAPPRTTRALSDTLERQVGMFRKYMKLSMLPVLAVSFVRAACENGAPTENLLGPATGAPAFEVIETTLPDGYKVVQETDPTVGYVQGIIDERGGSLQIGSHKIDVP